VIRPWQESIAGGAAVGAGVYLVMPPWTTSAWAVPFGITIGLLGFFLLSDASRRSAAMLLFGRQSGASLSWRDNIELHKAAGWHDRQRLASVLERLGRPDIAEPTKGMSARKRLPWLLAGLGAMGLLVLVPLQFSSLLQSRIPQAIMAFGFAVMVLAFEISSFRGLQLWFEVPPRQSA
jgi:hypothetical protein